MFIKHLQSPFYTLENALRWRAASLDSALLAHRSYSRNLGSWQKKQEYTFRATFASRSQRWSSHYICFQVMKTVQVSLKRVGFWLRRCVHALARPNFSTVHCASLCMFYVFLQTVMAHCIHLEEREVELFKKRGVGISHCPCSNLWYKSRFRSFVSQGCIHH